MRGNYIRAITMALFLGTLMFITIATNSKFSILSFLTGVFFYALFLLLTTLMDDPKEMKIKKGKEKMEEDKLKREFFLKNKKESVRATKHLFWVIGLIIITSILCGTLIWINSHAWVIRFEMDANTLEAFKSIDWEILKYGRT